MTTVIAAATLAGTAGWLGCAGAVSRTAPGRLAGDRIRPGTWGAVAGAALGAAWWLLGVTDLVLCLIGVMTAVGCVRLVVRSRRAAAADGRADQVLLACEGMAAELAAGRPPLAALRRAADEWSELVPVAAAGDLDADVPTVLRDLAAMPGAGQLRMVAAAWQVAHRSGSGLAEALAQVAAGLRDERRTRLLVAAELAAARATARLMALLPFVVLLMGVGVGGDPVGFLLRTPAGLGCLAAGLSLSFWGMAWLERIADGVLAR